jgi:hypothetical protein
MPSVCVISRKVKAQTSKIKIPPISRTAGRHGMFPEGLMLAMAHRCMRIPCQSMSTSRFTAPKSLIGLAVRRESFSWDGRIKRKFGENLLASGQFKSLHLGVIVKKCVSYRRDNALPRVRGPKPDESRPKSAILGGAACPKSLTLHSRGVRDLFASCVSRQYC